MPNFHIFLGIPEMEDYYNNLILECKKSNPNKNKIKELKKFEKVVKLISLDPKYPSLNTHEIDELAKRYGIKVFESYLENKTPAAGRIFWVYGPKKQSITIIGLEPHPNDKANSYKKIVLSSMK